MCPRSPIVNEKAKFVHWQADPRGHTLNHDPTSSGQNKVKISGCPFSILNFHNSVNCFINSVVSLLSFGDLEEIL